MTPLSSPHRAIAREALAADGEIAAIAAAHSLSEAALIDLVTAYLKEKADTGKGPAEQTAPVGAAVTITRDDRGLPHIAADTQADLFFASATHTPRIASGSSISTVATHTAHSRKSWDPPPE